MTSQVVLLNGFAVAIASDSAVTFGDSRTFDSAEKVFPIGGAHNVAVLHSGAVFLLEYPYQVLVAEWSQTLPKDPLPTVEAYVKSFTFWLTQLSPSFSNKNQVDFYGKTFDDAVRVCYQIVKEQFEESPGIGVLAAINNAKSIIRSRIQQLSSLEKIQNSDLDFVHSVMGSHEKWNEDRVRFFFDDWPEDQELCELGLEYVRHYIHYAYWRDTATLAFCGFGKEQILPAFSRVEIYGVMGKRCLWREHENAVYSPQVGGRMFSIFPLGQSDTIFEFLKGIDLRVQDLALDLAIEASDIGEAIFRDKILGRLENHEFKDQLVEVVGQAFDDDERLRDTEARIVALLDERFDQHMEQTRLEQLRTIVRGLPPATLASVAQSLVAIVPLRQALSGDLSTVGGPIDVATITRVGGFSWVQHKSVKL